MKKIITSALTLLAITLPAQADNLASQLAECSQKKDSLTRLVCYDQLAKGQDVTKLASVAPKKVDKQPLIAETPVRSVVAPKDDSFGSENLKKPEGESKVQELIVTVKSAKQTLHKLWKITFENGQTWIQTESGSAVKFKKGNKVILERGTFGSYWMKRADSNRTIRVKRIK